MNGIDGIRVLVVRIIANLIQRIAPHLASAALFLLLSMAMTWPLVRCLGTAVSDPGDPFINTWILDWDVWATRHQPLLLFHAGIFHPAKYTLAFSENLYGVALVLMPFRAAGASLLTAYNIGILLGFAFSGFAAYVLGRMLTGSWIAGFAAGVFYAFVPFRFTHLPHIQHVWGGWLALLPAVLLWYVARPSWKRAAAFGFVFLMNGLTNIHWFLFGSVAIALTIAVLAIRGERRWLPLIVCTVAALGLLAPFLYPYHAAAKLYGAERTWEETLRYSATLRDWIFRSAEPERRLFPGFVAIVLSIVGLCVGPAILPVRGRQDCRPYTVLWLALGVLGSLGLNAFFHTMLFNVVPGFRAIRAPARWAAVAYTGMAMLIALAASRRKWIGALAAIALLLELRQAPIRWYSVVAEPREVDTWLASTPTRGAIIELPINVTGSEAMAMFRATVHHKPIVNGISGFAPPQYQRLVSLWNQDAFVDELAHAGVEYLIVHADAVDARDWLRRELDRGRIRFVRRFNGGASGDWVFSLHGPRATSPDLEAFLRGEPTYNSAAFGTLDYPRPNEVLGNRPFFSGWAFSPYGVRAVELRFNNGGVRIPTTLIAEAGLHAKFPWYSNVPRPRYVASFGPRPPGVRRFTDVQPAIIDERGVVTLLEDRWIEWP